MQQLWTVILQFLLAALVTSQRQPTETCTALDQMVENTPLIVQCTRNVDCNEAVCNVNSFGYRIEMELRPCHSPIGVYIKAFKDGGLVLSQLVDHSQRFTIEGVQVPVEMSQIEPSQPGALRSIAFKVDAIIGSIRLALVRRTVIPIDTSSCQVVTEAPTQPTEASVELTSEIVTTTEIATDPTSESTETTATELTPEITTETTSEASAELTSETVTTTETATDPTSEPPQVTSEVTTETTSEASAEPTGVVVTVSPSVDPTNEVDSTTETSTTIQSTTETTDSSVTTFSLRPIPLAGDTICQALENLAVQAFPPDTAVTLDLDIKCIVNDKCDGLICFNYPVGATAGTLDPHVAITLLPCNMPPAVKIESFDVNGELKFSDTIEKNVWMDETGGIFGLKTEVVLSRYDDSIDIKVSVADPEHPEVTTAVIYAAIPLERSNCNSEIQGGSGSSSQWKATAGVMLLNVALTAIVSALLLGLELGEDFALA